MQMLRDEKGANSPFLAGLPDCELSPGLRRLIGDATRDEPFDYDAYAIRQAEAFNARQGDRPGPPCPICRNKGQVYRVEDGIITASICQCEAVRQSEARLSRTGLAAVAELYTLDNFTAKEPWQRTVKAQAERYINDPARKWLAMLGQPGCGKTHLCSAAAVELMRRNSWSMRYMPWRDEVTRIKAEVTNSDGYQAIMHPLKTAQVLYIDDFFKTETGSNPTPGDVNVAFELLNHRYNNPQLATILSSERTVNEILDIDEAVGSRIYERTKGFCVELEQDKSKNYRLRP